MCNVMYVCIYIYICMHIYWFIFALRGLLNARTSALYRIQVENQSAAKHFCNTTDRNHDTFPWFVNEGLAWTNLCFPQRLNSRSKGYAIALRDQSALFDWVVLKPTYLQQTLGTLAKNKIHTQRTWFFLACFIPSHANFKPTWLNMPRMCLLSLSFTEVPS
jgi:hypothetical protein